MNSDRRLLFRVSSILGKTVGELESCMTISELKEWDEYLRLEPPMSLKTERQLAMLISLLHNIHSKEKSDPIDFMFLTDEERQLIKHKRLIEKLDKFGE